ncbi:hypothetical protein HJG43_03495 [Kineosporiaceae bacterium SCSIO 59966]|nr:hypothetical protein HJG43_03495 [Kineosporiaceae bacterium SCSIO 59966]
MPRPSDRHARPVAAAVAAVGALGAVWAAFGEGSAALALVVVLQTGVLLGLLLLWRRVRRLDTRLDVLLDRATRRTAGPPATDNAPVLDALGAERLDAAARHAELLEALERLADLARERNAAAHRHDAGDSHAS